MDNLETQQQETQQQETQQQETQQQEAQQQETQKQDHQPSPNSKRFKEVYGNWKHNERLVEELKQNNIQLQQKLEQIENRFKQEDEQKQQQTFLKEYTEALDTGDNEKAAKVQLEYNNFINSQSNPQLVKQQQPTYSIDTDMQYFKRFNPWYQTDQEKTALAQEINNEMLQDDNWRNRSNSEFLAEVANRTNKAYELKSRQASYNNSMFSDGISSAPETVSQEPKLSNAEKQIAIKMLYKPGVNTQEEAIKLYAQNK